MYFKRIEMIGFKSFADKTVINLEQGMTSIVGPNGCGKSNILDAMRWALGEQSAKQLRGSHMQDVIFNGSEERAPLGMAEVTLSFDNADGTLPLDFSEVQITRRIYRSGESEYFINKAPCRLRDIQEVFMDTGIGTNAYSMIGQGKIGLVLSSKPEDRRFLFEEAAGIIKYKSRKRVAMRKLDQAEQNLLRLHDIISEIERQMRSLKRQVNAAIRFREFKEQLQDLEIRAAWFKHREFSERITSQRVELAKAQDAFEKSSTQSTSLEARYEELNLKKLEVDRTLHARREGVHEIDTEMSEIEGQIALVRQQIQFSKKQQERAREEETQFTSLAGELDTRKQEAATNNESLQQEVVQCTAAFEDKQAELDTAHRAVSEAETHLEAMRAEAAAVANERVHVQTSVDSLDVAIERIDSRLNALYARQDEELRRGEELTVALEKAQSEQAKDEARRLELETSRREIEETTAALQTQMGEVNEQRQTLREEQGRVEARLHSLRELRDSYEGFATGVRAIMAAKQNEHECAAGVIGPAGDLVSTKAKYERAIEAALAGSINNVVVESAESAKRAITFLRTEQAGRVTFLPLNTIRPGQRDDIASVQNRPGVIGRALDLVQYDAAIRPAVEYLFYNTVIVETLDHALAIAQSGGAYPRLVTLDGEVISARGAVTGGRTRHDSRGLLGRSAEISELEVRLVTLGEEIKGFTQQGEQLTLSLEEVNTTGSRLEEDEANVRTRLAENGAEIARLVSSLESVEQQTRALVAEREALATERSAAEGEREDTRARAGDLDSKGEDVQRSLATAQDAAHAARHTQSGLTTDVSDSRVQLASLVHTREQIALDATRLDSEHENAVAEIARRVDSQSEHKTNELSLEDDIRDHLERTKALAESKETGRKKVIEAENERQGLLDESEQLESTLKALRDDVRAHQSALHQIEMDLRHDEDQIEFFQERILSEYNIALSSLNEDEIGEDEHDSEAREKLVSDLRTKLERMGTVNLMAIEEYEALVERHDFLATQAADLENARETLLNIVSRIDVTILDMFMETFKAVSENFRQYFRRVFNGGQARIYLLDEDDPLESGIEIEARPPGKKPQTITLLSGGEQAMTAIALLFSIFKSRPSPFCVLDEVDAPLDDANIGRFLSIVEEFAEESQFIVITHNKQTMACANALYGITMQERGVSNLVSVRFDERGDEAEPAA